MTISNENDMAGAKEFLLQEYQSLNTLLQDSKSRGESRLNIFVTFVAAVLTASFTAHSFVDPELRPIVFGGISVILEILGLITFRKMLTRRIESVVCRRKMNKITLWFIDNYPSVKAGLLYSDSNDIKMNWGAKGNLGSSAFSMAIINSGILFLSILTLGIMVFGLGSVASIIILSTAASLVLWAVHIIWKNIWIDNAEKIYKIYSSSRD